MENIYNYNLEYSVDTVTSNTLYSAPQMNTSSNGATSSMPISAPYINGAPISPNRTTQMMNPPQRRRVSPEYVDVDAQSKHHNYRSPHSASRKDYQFMNPKRYTRPPSDEEEDELTEEPPAPHAPEHEKVEYKRRQNTLAARRSRKRKLLYQQSLEMTVERLTMEKEVWKTRALTLKQLLQGHGIPCPDFND